MRRIALLLALLGTGACRRLPPEPVTPRQTGDEAAANRQPTAESRTDEASPAAAADAFVISERSAAIIDSIETAVRDSFALLRAGEAAALVRQDSIFAAARADSLAAAAALRDSLVAQARTDSIAAAATAAAALAAITRSDSIAAAARQDSIAAAARTDSLAMVAIEDSVAAARIAAAAVVPAAVAAADAPPEAVEDLEALRALGPSYIPYDDGPETIWNTETQATLSKTLLPVLREESLPATTRSIFWVLISREGRAEDIQIQTSSGSAAFDEAAESRHGSCGKSRSSCSEDLHRPDPISEEARSMRAPPFSSSAAPPQTRDPRPEGPRANRRSLPDWTRPNSSAA